MLPILRKAGSPLILALISIFSFHPQPPSAAQNRQSTEARLRALEDREEIRQLLIEYGRTLDRRDFTAFSRLFTEDAEYKGGATTGIRGSAAIARLLQETIEKNPMKVREPNFHLFANTMIQVNGDEATAASKGLFVVPNASGVPEIVMMATYEDVLIREGRGWKFKRRIVRADIPAPTRNK